MAKCARVPVLDRFSRCIYPLFLATTLEYTLLTGVAKADD